MPHFIVDSNLLMSRETSLPGGTTVHRVCIDWILNCPDHTIYVPSEVMAEVSRPIAHAITQRQAPSHPQHNRLGDFQNVRTEQNQRFFRENIGAAREFIRVETLAAQQVVAAANGWPWQGVITGPFDEGDARILATAKALRLPVLTANLRMKQQVQADNTSTRYKLFGEVPIWILGGTGNEGVPIPINPQTLNPQQIASEQQTINQRLQTCASTLPQPYRSNAMRPTTASTRPRRGSF